MKAKELDELFDSGKDMSEFWDLSKIKRPNQELKRVNVDFPLWMVQSLDKHARHLGVTRQSIIKVYISEQIKKTESSR